MLRAMACGTPTCSDGVALVKNRSILLKLRLRKSADILKFREEIVIKGYRYTA